LSGDCHLSRSCGVREQTFSYDGIGRIYQVSNSVNGAYVHYFYGPYYSYTLSTTNNLADEEYAIQVFDGLGRVIQAATNNPGSSGGYKATWTQFDAMGRVSRQYNPTEIDGNWNPYGDDAAGAAYTQQTYDWKGRPLITTNQDWTTRYASYTGCGCAGGEVATLTDEVGRQQKVYSDALGRPWRTEVLNWNGSVYSTTTNTLNARDQVTNIRQTANATGAYQDTTMGYDGYGRLSTKHAPEQNAGTATTYTYNPDDTILYVTDARGATATYGVNYRHLVTSISYSAPAGIVATMPVSFAYDAAGNRISMNDGSGSSSYSYDQLSQLNSETRYFAASGNSYTLTYGYNFAGEATSVSDSFGGQVSYVHDSIGRLSNVTGTGTVINNYVSSLGYRAWGSLKHMTYGNNMTYDLGFNARQEPTSFTVNGANITFGPPQNMSAGFEYYSDGRLKSARDFMDSSFDRAYSYDHAGRLEEAYSNQEARDFLAGIPSSGTDQGPYRESFSFDADGNMTRRAARVWSQPQDVLNVTYDFSTNRNTNPTWQYDADGNVKQADGLNAVYDAAGRPVQLTNAPGYLLYYDGDGNVVRRVQRDGNGHDFRNFYNVPSSVLGGRIIVQDVVTTIYQGNTLIYLDRFHYRFVHANDQLIGQEEADNDPHFSPSGTWIYHNPITGSTRGIDYLNNPSNQQSEPDAAGFNVGLSDPAQTGQPADDSTGPAVRDFELGEQCTINGITMNCGNIGLLTSSGSAVECPLCGSSTSVIYHGKLTLAFFNSFADGYQGFVPVTAGYIGGGEFTFTGKPLPRGYFRDRQRPVETDFSLLNQTGNNEADLSRIPESAFNDLSQGRQKTKAKPKPTPNPCETNKVLEFFNLRDEAPSEHIVPYINTRVSKDFLAALLEINQAIPGGIGFNSAFRTYEMQQVEKQRQDERIAAFNAQPWYKKIGHTPPNIAMAPGTSAHEAGFAFDVPLKYMLEHSEVEQIFNKHGFGRHVAGDAVHFEWDNWQNLETPERRVWIQKASTFYQNCIQGH
jgi:YD repeat-containing protein